MKTIRIIASLFLLASIARGEEPKIKVLIVDGFSNHDWRHTTECVEALLLESGLCEVTVTTAPVKDAAKLAQWRPEFPRYDVVVQNCNSLGSNYRWPEPVRADLEAYVRGGGGLFVLHSGNNSFADWPEYDRMIGLGWRKADQGVALEINDGQVVRIPAGRGGGTGHGPRSELLVRKLTEHPINHGYPVTWRTPDIELYAYARGPAENLTVLSYASKKEGDKQWPIEWVVNYGKGRVYNGTFGHIWHDRRQPESCQCVGFQTTLVRAVQWLAGREVTYPIPANFPTAEHVSLRPFELKYRPAEGWESLFNGQNLNGWTVRCRPDDKDKAFWKVADGAIECDSLGRPEHDYVWLEANKGYADFQLRLKFQAFKSSKGNSGVQFRSRYGDGWLDGPQVDVYPPDPLRTGLIYDETTGVRRWIYPSLPDSRMVREKAPASAQATRLVYADDDPAAWNTLELVADGTKVTTFVNGLRVADFNGAGILDDRVHADRQVGMAGKILLQLHTRDELRIRFKDLWIRTLTP
jgi:type 1 glutamine amidotransferase